jgi:hypothetical protein
VLPAWAAIDRSFFMRMMIPLQLILTLCAVLIAASPASAMGPAVSALPKTSADVVPVYYCRGYGGNCCGNGYRRYRYNDYGYGNYRNYGGYGYGNYGGYGDGGYRRYRGYDDNYPRYRRRYYSREYYYD